MASFIPPPYDLFSNQTPSTPVAPFASAPQPKQADGADGQSQEISYETVKAVVNYLAAKLDAKLAEVRPMAMGQSMNPANMRVMADLQIARSGLDNIAMLFVNGTLK